MKLFSASILLICLFVQSFSQPLIVLGYEVNLEYIAGSLCINRKQADNTCEGKCQLKKNLDQESDQEPGFELNLQQVLINHEAPTTALRINTEAIRYADNWQDIETDEVLSAVFHPPACFF